MKMRASYKINDWHSITVTNDFPDERAAKIAVLTVAMTGEIDNDERMLFIADNMDNVTVDVLE